MTNTSVSSAGPSENTTVFVSGSTFCMVPSLFQRVEKLSWNKRRDGFLHLSVNGGAASADVFELLLQFLMFGKLPETTRMTTRQAGELLKMIQLLLDDNNNVSMLAEHVKIILGAQQGKSNKSMSSFLRRSMPSMTLFKALSAEDVGGEYYSSKKEQNSIDLIDTNNSTTTKPTIGMGDHHDVSNNLQSDMIDDLFGVVDGSDTRMVLPIQDSLDNLPVLRVADSTDSASEVSSVSFHERKVSFSIEDALSIQYDNPRFSVHNNNNNNNNNNKLVSIDDNHDGILSEANNTGNMVMDDAAAVDDTLNSSSSLCSSSFRLSSSSTKSSFRKMYQKLTGHDVARTHAELCSSEYVL